MRYYDISLHVSKWLKDEFETSKRKMHEMDYWQSIYIKYKGHNITTTNINIINKNEIMKILTCNTGNYQDSALMTSNNNNHKHNKTITIKHTKKDQERKK